MQYHVVTSLVDLLSSGTDTLAARYAMLGIDTRVSPPIWPIPAGQQSEEEVYRQCSDGCSSI
jgi:hypothetical protein